MKRSLLVLLMLLVFVVPGSSKVIVDGSKTPEAISDDVAFEQLVWTLYIPENPTPDQVLFVFGFAAMNNIDTKEVQELQRIAEKLLNYNKQIEKADEFDAKRLDTEKKQFINVSRLGHEQLNKEVQSIKSRIVISDNNEK